MEHDSQHVQLEIQLLGGRGQTAVSELDLQL
jgi:hypothetical protein